MRKAVTIAAGALLLAACGGNSEIVTGAIPDAGPGTVLESPIAASEAPVGPIEGGLTGADVGRSLSESERERALKAEYEALEYGRPGQPTAWHTGSGGAHGEISVGATYQVNRLDCREYTHNVWIGGRLRVVHGTACRQPDGVWRILG